MTSDSTQDRIGWDGIGWDGRERRRRRECRREVRSIAGNSMMVWRVRRVKEEINMAKRWRGKDDGRMVQGEGEVISLTSYLTPFSGQEMI